MAQAQAEARAQAHVAQVHDEEAQEQGVPPQLPCGVALEGQGSLPLPPARQAGPSPHHGAGLQPLLAEPATSPVSRDVSHSSASSFRGVLYTA